MKDIKNSDDHLCFCGSGIPYRDCCQPIIDAKQPATSAEQLMRSRYSAYVTENREYLQKSWHPDTRPAELVLGSGELHWTGLSVLKCQRGEAGDRSGRVEFIARYEQSGVPGEVHEDSRFVFEQGQWLYVDGDMKSTTRVGRNDPCPCGSGKKYKKCCGV